MPLTAKQQAFVEAYAGNATDAARKAGYAGSDDTLAQVGHANLRNLKIAAAIAARGAQASKRRIASREERQAFWTGVMEDAAEEMSARLKASELLGKSEADFLERLQHEGNVTLKVVNPYAEKP